MRDTGDSFFQTLTPGDSFHALAEHPLGCHGHSSKRNVPTPEGCNLVWDIRLCFLISQGQKLGSFALIWDIAASAVTCRGSQGYSPAPHLTPSFPGAQDRSRRRPPSERGEQTKVSPGINVRERITGLKDTRKLSAIAFTGTAGDSFFCTRHRVTLFSRLRDLRPATRVHHGLRHRWPKKKVRK